MEQNNQELDKIRNIIKETINEEFGLENKIFNNDNFSQKDAMEYYV